MFEAFGSRVAGVVKGVTARGSAAVAGLSVAMIGAPAFAAGDFDVTSVTTAITAAGVAVATIGAAVIIVKFGAKAWKWITSAG